MKINAVITKKPALKKPNFKSLKIDTNLLIIAITIALSTLLGSFLYNIESPTFTSELFKQFLRFTTDYKGKTFVETFCGFYVMDLLYLLLVTIFGLSAFGRIPILSTVICKTIGIGSLGAYFLDCFAEKGFEYYALIIMPGTIIMLFATLLSAQNCFFTSKVTKALIEKKESSQLNIKLYLMRNSVSAIIFAFSSLIDTLCLRVFAKYFEQALSNIN